MWWKEPLVDATRLSKPCGGGLHTVEQFSISSTCISSCQVHIASIDDANQVTLPIFVLLNRADGPVLDGFLLVPSVRSLSVRRIGRWSPLDLTFPLEAALSPSFPVRHGGPNSKKVEQGCRTGRTAHTSKAHCSSASTSMKLLSLHQFCNRTDPGRFL